MNGIITGVSHGPLDTGLAHLPRNQFQVNFKTLTAGGVWGLTSVLILFVNSYEDFDYTNQLGYFCAALAVFLAVAAVEFSRLHAPLRRLHNAAPWLIAIGLGIALWEVITAKTGSLPRPFFVPPEDLLGVYIDDWSKLLECVYHSVALLMTGFAFGSVAGFATGVALGWSKAVSYWGHPILRWIGPLPATAWLPIAFFAFPSSFSAAVFLIALASGVPVAILTWSGVSSVGSAYYDIARTLGANQRFLVLKVAIPAAMPSVFVGLFMGLSSSFAVLVVAEMMGVKAGLGWYLQWAQGWAAYGNMYAALAVMAFMCSSLVTVLFAVRGRLLAWQKGLLRW